MRQALGGSTTGIVKVADEAWIAAALLQRENPDQPDFAIEEIVARAERESMVGALRPGVYVHIVQHCVANRPPNPGRYRMLLETGEGRRRLFRDGDSYDPAREGSKITPSPDGIPVAYHSLLGWYEGWARTQRQYEPRQDLLLGLAGTGAKLWMNEPADSYVK